MTYQNRNNYITSWNLYRAGDTGSTYSLVSSVPVTQSVFIDDIGVDGLGVTLGTSYTDTEGNSVTYAPPPANAFCPTLYMGMLFMIVGNTVQWTPVESPDAWPPGYSVSFPFAPLWLEAFGGGLCVFCPDRIYRLDGTDGGNMQRTELRADGCIAPYSVQKAQNICIYLSKRGIMMFDGHSAQCISEPAIPYKMFTFPDWITTNSIPQQWWWRTTDNEAQYGELLWASGNSITALDPTGQVTARDVPADGIVYGIKSFVWLNKYFLYYSDALSTDHVMGTTWCLDLGTPGSPITTLGMKVLDAHVTETGDAYILVNSYPDDRTSDFLAVQSIFDGTPGYQSGPTGSALMRFNPLSALKVPIRIRSSENSAGSPQLRKRWREVRVFGDGTCQLRVYIDGELITLANGETAAVIDCTDKPGYPRRILLPPGTWGESIAYEIIGSIDIRAIQAGFDWMTGKTHG
jgi:hypothetical protein